MRKPGLAIAVILVLGLVAGGCGDQRGHAPPISTVPAAPGQPKRFTAPDKDVTFAYPSGWNFDQRPAPGVATVSTGGAEVTVWAYPARVTVTDNGTATAAMGRFLASLKERDPSFRVTKSKTIQATGGAGFEVIGTTTIAGHDVEVRSVHVYVGKGEYVVDGIADPTQFNGVNASVFQPLLQSAVFGGSPAPVSSAPEIQNGD